MKREEWKSMLNGQHREEMDALRERIEELRNLESVSFDKC